MITSYKNKKEGGEKKLESSPNFLELDILPWCLFFTGTVELFIIPSPSYFKTDKGFGGGGVEIIPSFQMEAEICSRTHSRSWTRHTHTGTHWSLTCANTHSLRCFLLPLMRFYLQLLDSTASSSLADVTLKRLQMATSKGYIRVSYFANVRCETSSWDNYVTLTSPKTVEFL